MLPRYWCFVLIVFTFQVQAKPEVYQFQLENGLKILVKPDHRAPVVVSQVWYKVGSSYEHDGITGVSHILEHMMFKGTPNYPSGEFSRIISKLGGRENAFTGQDYTAYFQRVEKRHLETCLKLEADRMRHLLLDEKSFAKENKVVMEERRLRTEDKPQSLTYEHFLATAFMNHPYRIPTIGWMNDLENMRIEDLKIWYKKWYAPNNATLVVVGDVEPKQVLKLAKQYFSGLKPSKIEELKPVIEAKQLGTKRITVSVPAKLPYLLMGYKVPVLRTQPDEKEIYALAVLAGILDGGDSARLAKQLVRGKQMAASASASYDMYDRLSGLFLLSAIPTKAYKIPQLEQALLDQITTLQTTLIDQEELNRVKAQVVASNVYEQDSIFYQAMKIGILETVGLDWRDSVRYLEKIRAVTAEQVRAVAQKYLIAKHLTVAVLDPQPLAKK